MVLRGWSLGRSFQVWQGKARMNRWASRRILSMFSSLLMLGSMRTIFHRHWHKKQKKMKIFQHSCMPPSLYQHYTVRWHQNRKDDKNMICAIHRGKSTPAWGRSNCSLGVKPSKYRCSKQWPCVSTDLMHNDPHHVLSSSPCYWPGTYSNHPPPTPPTKLWQFILAGSVLSALANQTLGVLLKLSPLTKIKCTYHHCDWLFTVQCTND